MLSVRSALECIGASTTGDVSVLGQLFGFWRGQVPDDPGTGSPVTVSVLQQLQDLQGTHIHLNVIEVGFDTLGASDRDTADNALDYALYKIRKVYNTVGLGVGRINYYGLTSAAAGGKDDLGSEDEAEELHCDWGVDNNGLDVFIVRNISDPDFIGISPVEGSCDNGDKDDGLIGGEISRRDDPDGFARTFAHEIGHFLGLSHNHDDDACPTSTNARDNLMAQTKCATSVRDSVQLTLLQGSKMKNHCSMRSGC